MDMGASVLNHSYLSHHRSERSDTPLPGACCFYRLYSIGMPLACDVSLSQAPIFVAHQSHKQPGIGLHERGRAACVRGVS